MSAAAVGEVRVCVQRGRARSGGRRLDDHSGRGPPRARAHAFFFFFFLGRRASERRRRAHRSARGKLSSGPPSSIRSLITTAIAPAAPEIIAGLPPIAAVMSPRKNLKAWGCVCGGGACVCVNPNGSDGGVGWHAP